jgi:hypothetical protein
LRGLQKRRPKPPLFAIAQRHQTSATYFSELRWTRGAYESVGGSRWDGGPLTKNEYLVRDNRGAYGARQTTDKNQQVPYLTDAEFDRLDAPMTRLVHLMVDALSKSRLDLEYFANQPTAT